VAAPDLLIFCPRELSSLRARRLRAQAALPDILWLSAGGAANGDRRGQHRVTGGSITLNGVVVVGPSRLTNRTEFVEVKVAGLPIESTLVVSLSGKPGDSFTMTISDSTAR
jgi:hypothetical protein